MHFALPLILFAAALSLGLGLVLPLVRIERLFFDGVLEPEEGALRPDLGRPGLGLEFRRKDAERYAA